MNKQIIQAEDFNQNLFSVYDGLEIIKIKEKEEKQDLLEVKCENAIFEVEKNQRNIDMVVEKNLPPLIKGRNDKLTKGKSHHNLLKAFKKKIKESNTNQEHHQEEIIKKIEEKSSSEEDNENIMNENIMFGNKTKIIVRFLLMEQNKNNSDVNLLNEDKKRIRL